MPYRLRKAPGKALYWVVGEDGKHFSKEPMPKEKAKAQLRALYANAPPEEETGARKGAGFLDDISKAIKSAYNEVADMDSASWKKVKSVGDLDSEFWVTKHLPTATQKYLEDFGGVQVTQCIVRKAPVRKALEVALEAFSLGKWEETKKKLGYDSMFHLAVIVNKDIAIQKLARVDVGKADNPANAEFRVIKVTGVITLRQMLEKTRERMGDQDFYKYDPFNNNCQDFINNLLLANSDVLEYDRMDREFVKQPMDEMIADLPKFLPKFARTITSLGGLVGGAEGEATGGAGAPIDVEVLFSALEDLVGGAYGSKDTYRVAETRTLEGRKREGKRQLDEIEASLRALAHKFGAVNTPEGQLAAVGARVMADDAYEHRTGEPIDVGHRRYADEQIKQAFRLTRPDQIAELGRVNETMARYGLEGREGRAEAYRILYEGVPPPRAPEPVARIKTPAEIRAEEEAEERERAAGERERARLARVAEEEATAARLAAEAENAARERDIAEATAREEARRAQAEREAKEDAERRAAERAAQELEARQAEEARAERAREEAERDRATRALQEAEANAARLRLAALNAKTLDDLAFVENDAAQAIVGERNEATKVRNFIMGAIAGLTSRISRETRELNDMETNPVNYLKGLPHVYGFLPGVSDYTYEVTPPLTLPEVRAQIARLEHEIGEYPAAVLDHMRGETMSETDRHYSDRFLVLTVRIPELGFIGESVKMRVPPSGLKPTLKSFKKVEEDMVASEPNLRERIARKRSGLEEDMARLRDYTRQKEEAEEKIRSADRRVTELKREFDAKKEELEKLLKAAEKGKKKKGKGQEHLPFPYAKKRASKKEKAVERSRHYRTLYRGALFGTVESEDLHKGDDVGVALKEKRKIEKATPKKKLMEKLGDVLEFTKVAPPELKAVVDKRGPKVFKPKVTLPKKDSVRKPYVGKVMRETFMEKVKGRGEKEVRNLFNRAKRLYKEGGRSWEDITQQLAG